MARRTDYSGIKPDVKNANKGTERGRYMVEASLRETGAGRSILLDKDGRIIAGNKTFEAASDIGLPVRVVETDGTELVAVKRTDLDLDDDTGTARKLAYYDNRASEISLSWDAEQMLADLSAGLDLSAMFKQDELDELLADLQPKGTEGDTPAEVDRAEELRQKWGTAPGQLWQLGEHRLVCGDCTDAATVARVMGGEKANGIATDPPYAFGLSSTANEGSKAGGWHDMMNNASWFADRLRQWAVVAPDCIWWMFCNWRTLPIVMKAGHDAKEAIVSVMIWNKDWIGPGGTRGLRPAYEMIALFANGNGKITDRGQPDVVTVGWSSHKPTGHAAEKPVELLAHLIGMIDGLIIFEPFSGSGTTIIACENLSRRCRACEISPAYVAVALERFFVHSGKLPVLISSE